MDLAVSKCKVTGKTVVVLEGAWVTKEVHKVVVDTFNEQQLGWLVIKEICGAAIIRGEDSPDDELIVIKFETSGLGQRMEVMRRLSVAIADVVDPELVKIKVSYKEDGKEGLEYCQMMAGIIGCETAVDETEKVITFFPESNRQYNELKEELVHFVIL